MHDLFGSRDIAEEARGEAEEELADLAIGAISVAIRLAIAVPEHAGVREAIGVARAYLASGLTGVVDALVRARAVVVGGALDADVAAAVAARRPARAIAITDTLHALISAGATLAARAVVIDDAVHAGALVRAHL